MAKHQVPHGTFVGVTSEVKHIWNTRHLEPNLNGCRHDGLFGHCNSSDVDLKPITKDRFWHRVSQILSKREMHVVHMRFVLDLTFDESAERLGVTRERVRQVEAKALRKLYGYEWRGA